MISVPGPTIPGPTIGPPPAAVIPLVDATDPAVVGRKAAGLARLLRLGFTVPDGFVVTAGADLGSPELRETIAARLATLDGAVAVRSSATVEDLADASFAGMYETVLGVEGLDQVVAAIERVRASSRSDRVAAYRQDQVTTTDAPAMAVLVQRMVPADAAGVAFSADPLTGDRSTVIINAVAGLGDRLVSGEAAAEEWVVGPAGARLRRHAEAALDANAARAVADVVRRIETIDGVPIDVEWAMAAGTVSLLQARPMTALPEPVSWDPGLPGAWLRDFRLGEWLGAPVTPLFESWALTRIEGALNRVLGGVLGIEPPQPGHVVVNGWYYYGFNVFPPSRLGMLGFLVRHLVPNLILRPRMAARAVPPLAWLGIEQAEREWRTDVLPGYRSLVERARVEVEEADPLAIISLVDRLADAAGEYFASVTMVAGFASKSELPLARFYGASLHPRIGGSHLDLLIGLGEGPRGAAPHALRSLDWSEPTLGESGSVVDEAAGRLRHEDAAARRRAAEAAARGALIGVPKLRRRFDGLLATAQRYALVREEQVGDFSLAWPVMRRGLARLAATLVELGAIAEPGQIHFLTRAELQGAFGSDAAGSLATEADDRRAAWQRQSRLVAPLTLGTLHPLFARVIDEATDAIRGSVGDIGDAIVGIPASPGRASGPARIVRGAHEFDRVQPGDVLVCPVTAPAWTPLFGTVAAVVTDTGGVAAHASVVAREYGLPAVVGTGDATTRLRDGDLVEVDGSTGIVRAAAG
jgi:pyruvate,water dikinase